MDMARPKQDPPSQFGDIVTAAIRRGMVEFEMSGRGLARRLQRSEGYVRDRLNGKYEFALADIEHFALFIGMTPEDFVGSIDRETLSPELPERSAQTSNVLSIAERIGGRRPPGAIPRNVRGSGEDEAPAAARPRDPEPTDEQ